MARLGWIAIAGVVATAAPAMAQDESRGEFSAGWRQYHATIRSTSNPYLVDKPNDFPKGWYGDVAIHVSPKFAIVGEAGGSYFKQASDQTQGSFAIHQRDEITFHTFLGGVRVRAPQNAAIVPFGQVLFGGERDSSSYRHEVTFPTSTPSVSQAETSSSNAVLALDGGVTFAAGFLGVRTAVGYARLFSRADADAFRFSLGAAVRF